jgi:hypothetical protein
LSDFINIFKLLMSVVEKMIPFLKRQDDLNKLNETVEKATYLQAHESRLVERFQRADFWHQATGQQFSANKILVLEKIMQNPDVTKRQAIAATKQARINPDGSVTLGSGGRRGFVNFLAVEVILIICLSSFILGVSSLLKMPDAPADSTLFTNFFWPGALLLIGLFGIVFTIRLMDLIIDASIVQRAFLGKTIKIQNRKP